MTPKFLVTTYINEYQYKQYSCLSIIPFVLYTLILSYFDSTDKFAQNSIKDKLHISLSNDNTLIKCTKCSQSDCELNDIVLGTKVIFTDCYHWIFKAIQIPCIASCSIGLYFYESINENSINHKHLIEVSLDSSLLFCYYTKNIKKNDVIEMVLNKKKNLVLYFNHGQQYCDFPVLLFTADFMENNIGFMVGIHFHDYNERCDNGGIKLMDSGYIDSEPKYETHIKFPYLSDNASETTINGYGLYN